MKKSRVRITLYRFAGRWLFFRVKNRRGRFGEGPQRPGTGDERFSRTAALSIDPAAPGGA